MSDRLRNLTEDVQFKLFVPDISFEEAQRNVPWTMRLDLPKSSHFIGVIEIEHPTAVLMRTMGLNASKSIAYAYMVRGGREEEAIRPIFVTSVFAGTDVPWSDKLVFPDDGDVFCECLGITTQSGVPLVHVGLTVLHKDEDELVKAADAFEDEIKDGYLVVKPKEYDTDKQLRLLMQAKQAVAERGSPRERARRGSVEEPVAGEAGPGVGTPSDGGPSSGGTSSS